LLATLWLSVGTGLLVLLIAAIGKKNRQECSGYTITIKGSGDHFFVNKSDIVKLLTAATNGHIKGEAMKSFNLMAVENLLEENVWINDAELYFDNQDLLHVSVYERQPVARVFTTTGNSFYIDSNLVRMPLSENYSARVPVFTDFPEKKLWSGKDSMLIKQVKTAAVFIMSDPFWMAQVAQVDINEERQFEMLPTIGNHLVKLGSGKDIEKKFHRLFVFYTQVLRKTGFDKYSIIDVQFDGQVIGTPRGATVKKVDASQLRTNVLKLIERSKEVRQQAEKENAQKQADASVNSKPVITANTNKPGPEKISSSKQVKPQTQNPVPKAVMPKREN
jgi:cell division protein FtsQ